MSKTPPFEFDYERRHFLGKSIALAGLVGVVGTSTSVFADNNASSHNTSRLSEQQVLQMGLKAPSFTVEAPDGVVMTLTRKLRVARQYQELLYLAYENEPSIHVYDVGSLLHRFDIQFNDQFGVLKDFAVSDNGDVYALFSGQHAIFHLSSNGSLIQTISEFGIDKPEHLNGPRSLTIDSQGNIHVWDAGTRHIKVFTTDNQFVRQYGKARLSPITLVQDIDGRDPIIVTGGQSTKQTWIFTV